MQEHADQEHDSVSPCFVAAMVCLEKLYLLHERIDWEETAVKREELNPRENQIRSRCHLYLGIGHNCKAVEVETGKKGIN